MKLLSRFDVFAWTLLLIAAQFNVAKLPTLRAADPAPADAELLRAMETLNTAFKNRDTATIRRLITPDHLAVTSYYDGPFTVEQELQTLPDLEYAEYKSGELKVTPLGRDAAVVHYTLTLKGTFQGKPLPLKNYAAATWVRQNGQWREAYYQETPVTGK